MTDPQLYLINTLLAERDMTLLPDGSDPDVPRANMTLSEASAEISRLLLIRVSVTMEPTAEAASDMVTGNGNLPVGYHAMGYGIPEGYYAVKSITGNNDFDFFRIDHPDRGKWAGHTFVKRVIGGHADENVRGMQARSAILAISEAGPEAAGELYGKEVGNCYKCNIHLTKYASRVLKMGRTCAGKVGKGELWDRIQAEAGEESDGVQQVPAARRGKGTVPASRRPTRSGRRTRAA
jgi:hypothetical protein